MRAIAVRRDDALELIAASSSAACGIDRRHRIVYWNDSASALLGWGAAEVLGKSCYEAFAGRDLFGNFCCFRDCGVAVGALRGEEAEPFVMDVRRKDGTPLRLITRTLVFPSAGASYTCLVHLFENGDAGALSSIVLRAKAAVAEPPEECAGPPQPAILLSPRERQILGLLSEGFGSVNIAARLDLSHATIRNHVQHLLRRMGVHSQVEAVSVAFRRGLLEKDRDGGDGRIRTDE